MTTSSPEPSGLVTVTIIRKLIGWTAIFFPALLIILSFASGRCDAVQESISHYYYTIVGNVFVGALSTIAILLIIYKGYPHSQDFIATTIAGVFGVGVALFPTSVSTCGNTDCIVVTLSDIDVSAIHYGCATIMFGALAYICLVLFRKKDDHPTAEKVTRDKFYMLCGILIIASMAAILIFQLASSNEFLCKSKIVLILEWVALVAFGFSWLIKGGLIFRDKD